MENKEETRHREQQLEDLYPNIDVGFLCWLRNNGYFTAPASTKHHGNYEGGLFDHSFVVANQPKRLTENNGLVWQNDRSPVLVGLFHDICKIDQYRHPVEKLHSMTGVQDFEIPDKWEYADDMLLKGHGDKSVMILASHIQLTEEEVMCIRYHMGAFTDNSEWNDYNRAIQKYPNVLWTHQADMIASQIIGV